MRFKNQMILLITSLLISSCFMRANRGFYDFEKSDYNEENAKKQLTQLKNGTLVVSIPSEKHKLNLLRKSNPAKYAEALKELNFTRENLILAMSKLYTYSDYVFIPDSSLVAFFENNDKNNILGPDGTLLTSHSIDTSSNYFVLKSFRDFDQMFIYDKFNKYPNQPFPYESTLKRNQLLESKEYNNNIDLKYRTYISEAIFILNARLIKANQIWN